MIALPAILYGAEVILLTQDTIVTIEKCQNQVAKFMLQIPQSSANISSLYRCWSSTCVVLDSSINRIEIPCILESSFIVRPRI